MKVLAKANGLMVELKENQIIKKDKAQSPTSYSLGEEKERQLEQGKIREDEYEDEDEDEDEDCLWKQP